MCPKCGSSEVRRLSLIYREAVSPPDETLAPAESADAVAAPAQRARQSQLSRQAAPPSRKHDALWSVAAVAAAVIAAGTASNPDLRTAIAVAVIVVAVHFAIRSRRHNREVFPRLHARWERSVMCRRCGNVFEA